MCLWITKYLDKVKDLMTDWIVVIVVDPNRIALIGLDGNVIAPMNPEVEPKIEIGSLLVVGAMTEYAD